ncbi:MAG: O-antigen ligase family protein [Sphingomonas adhaesiva]|uniref:O-antigen ligase family protein n=1 Tax=Sphingomonas adhaesiva TaxID=28212 RepID=UPI002FF712F0
MSSASTVDAHGGVTGSATAQVRALALVPLLVYAVLTQLDALGNRLSAYSPIGTTPLLLGALVAATGAMLLLPGASRRLGETMGARLVAALFCWAVFCWALSRHQSEGLTYLGKLAAALLPAFCLFIIADTPVRLRAVLCAIVAAGAVSAAIVLVEHHTHARLLSTSVAATTAGFEGVARSAGGSDENPTTAAQMLLVSILIAAAWLFSGERRWRWPLAALVAAGALALVFMSARSALIGLAAGAALIALGFRRRGFFPLLVVGGIVALLGAVPFLPPTLVDRFTAIGDFGQDPTLYRRISYLRIGWDLFQQSPVWGVGPGNFPLYYVTDAYRWMPGREPFPRELHNTYLDAATELGAIGFLLFAATLGHALRAAWRGAGSIDPVLRRTARAAGIALAGLMVACFFMPHKDLRYLWLIAGIAIQSGRLSSRPGEAA